MTGLDQLLGQSPGITALRERVGRVLARHGSGRALSPVLIQGETGTGNGLLARALHAGGPRGGGPFVDVNCAAIPETLLEAELFGYERGAFTDARQAKPGLFQAAHGGTLFLDEVGLLPEALQAKLLKVLEDRSVRRLGAVRSEPVDVWILAATNEDLPATVRARRFREDLYHRLAVLTVELPPLRERGADVLLLAAHFLARAAADYGLEARTLAEDAAEALRAHAWPGNIRELANVMERVALLSESAVVTAEALGLPTLPGSPPPEVGPAPAETTPGGLDEMVDRVERRRVLEALREVNGNITRAAALLGISRDKLRYRLVRHGLRPDRARGPRRTGGDPGGAAAPATAPPAQSPPAESPSAGWEPRRLALLHAAVTVAPGGDRPWSRTRVLEAGIDKVRSFGGRVEGLSPTGFIAAFGLEPVDDAPRRAAHAAMAIQKAAERAGPAPDGLAVRLGVHVSEVLVGPSDGGVQVDLDSRREAWGVLEDLVTGSEPGTIAVSEAAQPFLSRRFTLVAAEGAARGPGPVYRLVGDEGTGFRVGRRMSGFVGRRHELDLLHHHLASALRGRGGVVGIVGEAGLGKSRLVYEFRRTLGGTPVRHLNSRCLPYWSGAPYFVVREILRQFCAIAERDAGPVIASKVALALQAVGMDADEARPYLLALLGDQAGDRLTDLSSEAVRGRTFEILRHMALQGSRHRPIVFVGEDLQWIDRTSEECVASLVDNLAGAPILLVVTYRPGYRPPWSDKSYATQLALPPLTAEDSLSVVRSVLGRPVAEPLAGLILSRADGNPFFLEELARAVGEQGDQPTPEAVPGTIDEVLRARIGRLSEPSRRLLEAAAVLGREVPLGLLRAIGSPEESLEPALRELVQLEFLYELRGGPEPLHAFTHALTQEVVYQGLPAARRQALHAAAGQALEAAHAEHRELAYERLAHHYSRAGNAGKAIDYLTRVAKAAGLGHAHAEAVRALEEALGHVEGLPGDEREQRRLDLIRREAYSLIPLGRLAEILDLLLRHQDGFERLQDPALLGEYHFLLCRTYLFLGESVRATESARRALAEATRCGDESTQGKTHYLLAQQGPLSGEPLEGIRHGRQAVELLERAGERWWIGRAYWVLGLNHAQVGEFGPALAAEGRARAIGEAIGDRHLQSLAASTAGIITAFAGDGHAGIEACRRGLEHSTDPFGRAIAQGWLGYAYLEHGDPGAAIAQLEPSVQQLEQFRFRQFQGWFMAFLAEAHEAAGRVEPARALALRALGITRGCGFSYGVACARRVLGRVARRQGALAEAEAALGETARTFALVEARHEVARTQRDLALVCQARGRAGEAASLLEAAIRVFETLPAPRQVQQTRALAGELGLALPG